MEDFQEAVLGRWQKIIAPDTSTGKQRGHATMELPGVTAQSLPHFLEPGILYNPMEGRKGVH